MSDQTTGLAESMENPDTLPETAPQPRRAMSRLSWVVLGVAIVLLVVLGLQLLSVNRGQPSSGEAPDFTLFLFEEMGGGEFDLSDNRGKVIVLNFWASWCGPCRVEAPELQAVWDAYRDEEVVVVGVDWVDNTRDALAYIEEFGITYPNGPDLGTRIGDTYGIPAVPETWIIDRNGQIVQHFPGPVGARDLAHAINQALAE